MPGPAAAAATAAATALADAVRRRGPPPPARQAAARYALRPAAGSEAPWASLIDSVLRQRYGAAALASPAAQAVRLAWTHALAAGSYRTYASKVRGFIDFCLAAGRSPLPASAETVELYFGHLLAEGRVQARYFPQYLSAIRAIHRDLLLPMPESPISGALVSGGQHLQRAELQREESFPLPAHAAVAMVALAARDCETAPLPVLRACLAVAVAFAAMWRGSSVQGLRPQDVVIGDQEVCVTEVVRKGHTHADPRLRCLRLDCRHLPVLPAVLRVWVRRRGAAIGGAAPPQHFWQLPGESLSRGDHFAAWFAEAVAAVRATAPPGRRLHPHCVRRGAASAARALGVSMERICHLGGWALGSRAVWRYIDVSVVACRFAFAFFGYLLPPGLQTAWLPQG